MAESVVVANNVELVANNIQNKVGSSLIGLKSAAQEATGVSEPAIGILDNIRTFQEATVAKVQAVWEILKSQLDLQKDAERRARENEKELALERPGDRRPKGGSISGLGKAVDEAGEGFGTRLKDQLLGAGTALFTMAGLKSFAGKIFKRYGLGFIKISIWSVFCSMYIMF